MKASQSQIENFQLNLKHELDPVANYPDAVDILTRVKQDMKNELGASDDEIGELMEMHFGNCVEIDDAIVEVFPEHFDGR